MEDFDHKTYRETLAQDLQVIKKTDREMAAEVLKQERESIRYKMAQDAHRQARQTTVPEAGQDLSTQEQIDTNEQQETQESVESMESMVENLVHLIKEGNGFRLDMGGIGSLTKNSRSMGYGEFNYDPSSGNLVPVAQATLDINLGQGSAPIQIGKTPSGRIQLLFQTRFQGNPTSQYCGDNRGGVHLTMRLLYHPNSDEFNNIEDQKIKELLSTLQGAELGELLYKTFIRSGEDLLNPGYMEFVLNNKKS